MRINSVKKRAMSERQALSYAACAPTSRFGHCDAFFEYPRDGARAMAWLAVTTTFTVMGTLHDDCSQAFVPPCRAVRGHSCGGRYETTAKLSQGLQLNWLEQWTHNHFQGACRGLDVCAGTDICGRLRAREASVNKRRQALTSNKMPTRSLSRFS